MNAFVYCSAVGSVEVMESESGFDLRCPADLEERLASLAALGEKRAEIGVLPSAFRLLRSCVLAVDPLSTATDNQLRAECERRFGTGGHNLDNLLRENKLLKATLAQYTDSSRRLHEALLPFIKADPQKQGFIVIDEWIAKQLTARDEWKRRAEAAEARATSLEARTPSVTLVSSISRKLAMPTCGDRTESPHGHYVCSEIDYRNPERPVLKFVKTDHPPSVERGPGLGAQRPDNSIAHLPEDLLCEDE